MPTAETMPACLGGWCRVRDRCERHITDHREHVVERLCDRGDEGQYRLISIRSVGDWERPMLPSLLRPAEPFDCLQVVV
jgi:hypothetical protein